jgi:acyl-lipid omega-6 desaturase (Delta-12 desaturase)
VPSLEEFKAYKHTIVLRYAKPDDVTGLQQVMISLAALIVLWLAVARLDRLSHWLSAVDGIFITLFTLRLMALMHECGHESLFRSSWLNRAFGFLLGVTTAMPQFVWSQHHGFHHEVSGDWESSRGTLNILSVDEYAALTAAQQKRYRRARSPALALLAGFLYLLFNPRITWLKGSAAFSSHVLRKKFNQPGVSFQAHAATFVGPYWKSAREAKHMLWNNVALLGLWLVMSWAVGPLLFFTIHIASISLTGAAAIVIFTVHHNFEDSYAVRTASLDHDAATLYGTSFVVLPSWLHWFTANVGYHHIHHLCPGIPNYAMVDCHREYAHLFDDVRRVMPSQILPTLKCILWDTRAQKIISIGEYEKQARAHPVPSC